MFNISIIGLGGIARAIAARSVAGGNAVELIARDTTKARHLAAALGGRATTAPVGVTPTGDIVILAVPYARASQVIAHYGDALAGKIIVDISNTFDTEARGLVTPVGSSGAQEIAKAVPASAHVVKAFNTIFGAVLASGLPLDVFVAGDDAQAKASVSSFVSALGLRPLDVGGLKAAHQLEGMGLLMKKLTGDGRAPSGLSLGVSTPS